MFDDDSSKIKLLSDTSDVLTNDVSTVAEIDRPFERKISSDVTNEKTHSSSQSKLDLEIDSSDSDSGPVRDKLGLKFSFYPTFGTKYPYTAAKEDITEEEVTTEHIDVEELENQLLDVLDQLANRHSN